VCSFPPQRLRKATLWSPFIDISLEPVGTSPCLVNLMNAANAPASVELTHVYDPVY